MEIHIAQIEWDGYRVNSLPVDTVLSIYPQPEYHHGRKALAMADLWAEIRPSAARGVLWLDPDVAADPDDLDAMLEAIKAEPGAMHTGLVKLWPASTGRPDWIWSHRGGSLGNPVASQTWDGLVAYVACGFLFTPRVLLDLAEPVMRPWRWEEVDVGLSELALTHDIPIRAVAGCTPKHLHF